MGASPMLPLIVEPEELAAHLGDPGLLLVDLTQQDIYDRGHIPGAVHVDYREIVAARPPAMGLLPEPAQLARCFGRIGLKATDHVVAYDDEGNGKAARFLWTLHAAGHANASLLNGGMLAWVEDERPLDDTRPHRESAEYPVKPVESVHADLDYVRARIGDAGAVLLDTRTPEEYRGAVKRAARAGHIPGAVNFNWTDAMDTARNLRLKPAESLRATLAGLGVTPDKEVIAYCQTHHRSAHTYVVLKHLGFERVRGYDGSWSEWGNRPDTPIE